MPVINTDNGFCVSVFFPDTCTLYATIKDGHKGAIVSLCAGKERMKHVYASKSDNLEIRIVTSDHNKDKVPNFLILYEGNTCRFPCEQTCCVQMGVIIK